jgi:hypothetical protein
MLYPNELLAHCLSYYLTFVRIEIIIRKIQFTRKKIGRGGEIRTPDILHPKQARYQTALHPDDFSKKTP